MKTVHGDLIALALEGRFDVIVHGCNCFHAMAGGIAAQIARAFPEAEQADRETEYGERAKLGFSSMVRVHRGEARFFIENAYTQFEPGRAVDYGAIDDAFDRLAWAYRQADNDPAPRHRIGYPMIGAGIAGGDWDRIAKIIDTRLAGMDHTLVVYAPRSV